MKALNVLLEEHEEGYDVRICDFGLLFALDGDRELPLRRQHAGSPRYMAPECYGSQITEKVDVWALGCLLVEVFGRHAPYVECTSAQQIAAAVLVQRRPPQIKPSPGNGAPARVLPLIQRCLHWKAADRCAAVDVHAALRE